MDKYLLEITSAEKRVEIQPRETKTATPYKTENDSRVVYMREVKDRLHLRTKDIVDEFEKQGFPITTFSLHQYMEGRVRGTDARMWSATGRSVKKSHIDDVFEQFKIMDKRLKEENRSLIGKPITALLQDWYKACEISPASNRYRPLSAIIGVNASTISRWSTGQANPKLPRIKESQRLVDAYAKRLLRKK